MSALQKPFRLGVVEGFFGRQWSWEARHAYADFLAERGCNAYIHAPKNVSWLRKQWHVPFPQAELEQLTLLSAHYRQAGLDFGIGLSPFELYLDFTAAKSDLLQHKLDQINTIAPQTLCILFDDMMGDLQDLAKVQLQIVDFICRHSTAESFVICPTYYSYDPLLTQHFGAQPEQYLEDLGTGLDPAIDVFWTGPKVISRHYPQEHLQEVATKLRRKPLLWDNYPVNDSRRLCSYLHLEPFTGRSSELHELTAGHLANPMNQPWLSRLPLYSLSSLYTDSNYEPARYFRAACRDLCTSELAGLLQRDAAAFQTAGLEKLGDELKQQLLLSYAAIQHPMAQEVCAWLQGEYIFDPACLT